MMSPIIDRTGMDAFEQLAADIFWNEGYWVRTSVKVELTREEKIRIGNRRDLNLKLDGDLSDMNGMRSCEFRIARGGDWGDPPQWIRSAARNFAPAPQPGVTLDSYRSSGVGFRVGRNLKRQ